MATSSITRNFVISGEEQVQKFIDVFEESKKYRDEPIHVASRQLKGEELRQFIRERNAMREGRR